MKLEKPYFVALDLDDHDFVMSLAQDLKDEVGGFKIGPRLLLKYGGALARRLSAFRPLFIDHKFYDIPSTMLSSIQACFDIGASFVTIHGAAGAEAMQKVFDLEQKLNTTRPFKVLVVTVLTSFSEDSMPVNWSKLSIEDHILKFAEAIHNSGLTGVVCSPFEAQLIKSKYPSLYTVTPGIRLAGNSSDDQKRIMTPSQALSQGADALVIGRPIVKSNKPIDVVCDINQLIKGL